MIDKGKINSIVNVIVRQYDPEKIILFGSYASGNFTQDSDLDLVIVKESSIPRFKRGSEIRKSLIGVGVPMDLLVYTPEEFEEGKNIRFSFLYSALKTSKLLYEK